MITNDYKTISSSIVAPNTTNIAAAGKNVLIHTINCPKALTGTATFRDMGTPTTYFVLPAGSIGCFIVDAVYGNGMDLVTSATDTVVVSYQNYN